ERVRRKNREARDLRETFVMSKVSGDRPPEQDPLQRRVRATFGHDEPSNLPARLADGLEVGSPRPRARASACSRIRPGGPYWPLWFPRAPRGGGALARRS